MASELGIKTICLSVYMTICHVSNSPSRVSDKEPQTSQEMKKPPLGFPRTILFKTFEARDFLYVFKSFHGTPSAFDGFMICLKGCNAILVKSCTEMEGPYIDYFHNQFNKPVLQIGPLVPDPHTGKLDDTWGNWLSQFPPKSVINSSFGSETFLTDHQIRELALGLELTGLPFFLVLNFPGNLDGSAELKRTLPHGFVERVKDRGIVQSGWVQQRPILAHESVGCNLSHAGFSSVIEGLINDCQLVMLPLKGDQFINSKLMELEWRVGVVVNRRDEDGYFGKEDVYEAVKIVMLETEKEPAITIRQNHKKWKEFLQNNEIQKKNILQILLSTCTLFRQNTTNNVIYVPFSLHALSQENN